MPHAQSPLHSGFGAASTAHDVVAGIDLSGKTAIVTGGYSGIGVETTRALLGAGARVIVPARDMTKAKANLDGLKVDLVAMDLADPASIDGFASTFLTSGDPLHLLVNSAGIMACPLTRDARGYEMQFATNHLGHFQLTARLWVALKRAHGARVVSLSSLGHRYAQVDFDDWNFERREYDRWVAYGQSKTANALFALALDELGAPHGIHAYSVHPGRIITDLARHMSREELQRMGGVDDQGRPVADLSRGMKNTEQGAATSVWAATSPLLNDIGGVYCEDCDIAALMPDDEATVAGSGSLSFGVRRWATDPAAARKLWSLSEELTGVSLG
ncbi:oxidoreductase [Dyella jiangningensis]|uniref:oxidoreductase n=1 Tax=Dyella jiangningensis TaxID=1379159 RepID=UPI00240F89F0|nr:oxidoreductase [Dyella jiangningensis]MDG2537811.1 oxidoreductase [Dyella jiangningensis]